MGTTDGNGVYTPDLDEEGWDPELATNFDLFSQSITDIAAHAVNTDAHIGRRNPLRPTAALYETFDRSTATANQAAWTSQTLVMVAIALPTGLSVASISFLSGTTALATGVHQYFGLYDSSRNLLRGSSDDTSAAWAANALKTLTLTSPFVTTYSGLHYIGILIQATTMPSIAGKGSTAATSNGLVPILSGTSSTAQTTLPNPAAAITATAAYLYAYVS